MSQCYWATKKWEAWNLRSIKEKWDVRECGTPKTGKNLDFLAFSILRILRKEYEHVSKKLHWNVLHLTCVAWHPVVCHSQHLLSMLISITTHFVLEGYVKKVYNCVEQSLDNMLPWLSDPTVKSVSKGVQLYRTIIKYGTGDIQKCMFYVWLVSR